MALSSCGDGRVRLCMKNSKSLDEMVWTYVMRRAKGIADLWAHKNLSVVQLLLAQLSLFAVPERATSLIFKDFDLKGLHYGV